jgi:hypothetical protein
MDGILAAFFGTVHCFIGFVNQIFRVESILRIEADTRAHFQCDKIAVY